jgi:hypothetical protein
VRKNGILVIGNIPAVETTTLVQVFVDNRSKPLDLGFVLRRSSSVCLKMPELVVVHERQSLNLSLTISHALFVT